MDNIKMFSMAVLENDVISGVQELVGFGTELLSYLPAARRITFIRGLLSLSFMHIGF